MTDSPIPEQDGQTVEGQNLSVDQAADAILEKLMKEEESQETAEESPEETQEDSETDANDESEADEDGTDEESSSDEEAEEREEEDEADEAKSVLDADAETFVRVKVDGEDREVSIRDLSRLYGQEASLTRKSQEVASARKTAEEQGARYVAALGKMVDQARAAAQPYREIDFVAAAQKLEPEQMAQLQQEANYAFQQEQFYNQELDGFMTELKESRRNELVERGKACVAELQRDIDGFNQQTYNDIRSYAVSVGIDHEIIDNLVDAPTFKMLHKAMLYDRGKVPGKVTKKKSKAPKKVIKSSKSGPRTSKAISGKANQKVASSMKKLQESGSIDDATDAFLARLEAAESDD